jgi:hypothetical protein
VKRNLPGIMLLCGLTVTLQGQATDAPAFHDKTFFDSAITPGMFAKFSLGVLYDQATVATPEWGSGADGLRKRAAWRMTGLLTRASAQYAVAKWRDTDPDYERCHCKGFGPRSRHALVSEFVEIRRDGSLGAPVARFSGIATSVAVTTPFQGSNPTAGTAAQRAVLLVGTDLGFNMLQEFWPEIRRTLLFRRK